MTVRWFGRIGWALMWQPQWCPLWLLGLNARGGPYRLGARLFNAATDYTPAKSRKKS